MEGSQTTGQQQAAPSAPASRFDGRFAPRFLIWWTGRDRNLIQPHTFEKILDRFAAYGHYAMPAAAVLALFFYVITAVKVSDSSFLIRGIGAVIAIAIAQFLADRFCSATRSFVEASPCRLSCGPFLEAFAVLAEVLAVVVLIGSFAGAEGSQRIARGCAGLAAAFFLFLYARCALHPSLASTDVRDGNTAGEEALGVASFLIKAASRLAPVGFGLGAIAGCIAILVGLFPLIDTGVHELGESGVYLALGSGMLPLASYLTLAFTHLGVELARAILDTPRRISDLGRSAEKKG